MDASLAAARLARAPATTPSSARELARLLDGWTEPALPADPWARWVLVALHRHLARQRWASEIVEQRLGGDLGAIARDGASGHPHDARSEGDVPGLPEWSYCFHGEGCCLTHRDGSSIDVDFIQGTAEWIDFFFYLKYLKSAPRLDVVEARLAGSEATDGYWIGDLVSLRQAGLIEGGLRARVTASGRAWAEALAPTLSALGTSTDRYAAAWLALELGDAPLAVQRLGDDAPPEIRALARSQIAPRLERLMGRVREAGVSHARFALQAIAELGRPIAEPVVLGELTREPLDGVVCAALEILASWSDARHVPMLRLVLESAIGEANPVPSIRMLAATALLRWGPRGLDEETRQALARALAAPAGPHEGAAGFLLALLDPDAGLRRLGEALRSRIPAARQGAAAGLGTLGTHDALAVLRASTALEAQLVLGLLRGYEPEPGWAPAPRVIEWKGQPQRVYRLDEIMASSAGEFVALEYRRFVERHEPLRRIWCAS